jgi:hypothetical protein
MPWRGSGIGTVQDCGVGNDRESLVKDFRSFLHHRVPGDGNGAGRPFILPTGAGASVIEVDATITPLAIHEPAPRTGTVN